MLKHAGNQFWCGGTVCFFVVSPHRTLKVWLLNLTRSFGFGAHNLSSRLLQYILVGVFVCTTNRRVHRIFSVIELSPKVFAGTVMKVIGSPYALSSHIGIDRMR